MYRIADRKQFRGLLKDSDSHALFNTSDGGGEAVEACADNDDV